MAIGTPTSLGANFAADGNAFITLTIGATGASVGDLVLVAVGNDGSDASNITVTDSKGNTYTGDIAMISSPDNYKGRILSSVLTTALVSSDTITATYVGQSGTWDKFIAVVKVTGSWDSSRVDKTASQAVASGTTWSSGNTATTTAAAELVFGLGLGGGAFSAHTPGASQTEIHDGGGISGWVDYATVYRITSSTGAYAASGSWTGGPDVGAGLVVTYKEVAAGGAFSLDAQPGSFALTGVAAGALAARALNAATGSYALTGIAASPLVGRALNAQPGSFSLTGVAATPLATRLMNAEPGTFTLAGVDALTAAGRVLNAEPGSYALIGSDAALLAARVLNAEPGSFVLTGIAAELVYVPAIGAYVLNAEAGVFSFTGIDASVVAGRSLDAQPGSFLLTGVDAATLAGRVLNAAPGSYTLTGTEAALLADRVLAALPGEFDLTGMQANLVYSGSAVVDPGTGRIVLRLEFGPYIRH